MIIKQTEWNLKPLLESEDEALIEKKRKEWEDATRNFISKWKGRTDYLKNPKIMKEALDDYENWVHYYGWEADEAYYFWLKTNQNQNDPELKAKFNKVEEFSKKIKNDVQFFALKIGKIPKSRQKNFLEYEDLNKYRHFLERRFALSKYMLSEKEEKIMNLKSPSAYSAWVKMVSGFLSKEEREVMDEEGNKVIKTYTDMSGLMQSQKKEVRDKSAEAFNDILREHVDVAEAEINAVLADKKTNDDLRKMKRPDFDRHLDDDIDSKVVDALIKAVSGRFDISRRFYELKAKLLGLKKLEYHERNVEYGKIAKQYKYEDAINLAHEVFSKLDKKFTDVLQNFVDKNQIDVFPRKGKVGGAFCVHFLILHPVYILLNYTGKLNDVLTLAHELGHGINNELMREKQHALYFGTSKATAEVASTFMEDFVLETLMKDADDELRLALMMQKLNDDVVSIIRQIACYIFEQELHSTFRKKGYLSKEEIGKLFQKHMSAYMGDYVEQSPGSENWWVHWPHIRDFFYNYSYASGLLISKALQRSVRENPEFIGKVKDFLSTGLSDSPKNIFAKTGIDITNKEFWNKGLDEIENLLNETEELAKSLGKI